jgi:alginate O-acetyltransferase complex protein AlgI
MLVFSIQIYGDFSGYSDIARGLGRWMGYDFPVNFNHPYVASSFREFWSRWHISLSSWFRDYVYIPLGGSRRGPSKAILFVWITMLISGLWHGAAWAFVFWGALHAGYLTIERLTNWPRRIEALPFGRCLGTAVVFTLVLIAWVFFRVGSLSHLTAGEQLRHALQIVYHMTNLTAIRPECVALVADKWSLLLVLLVLLRQLQHHPDIIGLRGRVRGLEGRLRWWLEPVAMASLVTACVFLRGPGAAFIYFQF